jgi:heme exporter protein CcmD
MDSIVETPYAYYIGSAYAIAILSCFVFLLATSLQARAGKKRVKRLEKALKNYDI